MTKQNNTDSTYNMDRAHYTNTNTTPLKHRTRTLKAFTLMELLVSISIIAVLIGVTSVSYTMAQKKARDSKRKEDIATIQKAMEQYYAENNQYPTTSADIDSAFPHQRPEDPKSPTMTYNWDNITTDSYCICAELEQTGTGNADAPNSSSCSWNQTGDYFCVQNQQ